MSLSRRTAVRRLLMGLLLLAALAGGLWWNSTRLNATEKLLVGAWEQSGDEGQVWGKFLLPNRTSFYVSKVNGRWGEVTTYGDRWWASPETWSSFRPVSKDDVLAPRVNTFSNWLAYAKVRLMGGHSSSLKILRLTEKEFVYSSRPSRTYEMRRSSDPELLRLFEQLSAGDLATLPE